DGANRNSICSLLRTRTNEGGAMRIIDVPHRTMPPGAVLVLSCLSMALLCAAAPLLAAETSSADNNVLEEVTVTAQRRSESLQTVPIAITAVTAAEMDRNGI